MKGYCDKCSVVIDETEITTHECDAYWIDGHFVVFWSGNSYYCHDRDLYVPKSKMVRLTPDRIYIDPDYAKRQTVWRQTKVLRNTDKNDLHLISFVKALNEPWKREFSKPQYKVSLP